MNKTTVLLLAAFTALALPGCQEKAASSQASPATKPALTATAAPTHTLDWPLTLAAGGNIAAWQDAVIGPEMCIRDRTRDILPSLAVSLGK